jgi:glycosyltransferase involved in cell wall biosynthesis
MVKIGLLMTLYNEEANIHRCLDSISPYLDYFCIGVDEKTTDNTKQKVLDYFEGNTRGKVFDSPWAGFADARNQCLDQADSSACDFYIYLDADHTLEVTDTEWTSKLSTDMDAYMLSVVGGSMTHWLPWLINTQTPYRWHSVLHEYIAHAGDAQEQTGGVLDTISIYHHYDGGGRAKGEGLYARDRDTFLTEFTTEKDPFLIQRYTFYLAQSCKDAGKPYWVDAIRYYKMRTVMGGWEEEIYESWMGLWEITTEVEHLYKAIETVKERPDAYFKLLQHGKSLGNWKVLRKALGLYEQVEEWNTMGLFMHPQYKWMVDDAAAMAYYELEDMERALKITQSLLLRDEVPEYEKERLRKNLPWFD